MLSGVGLYSMARKIARGEYGSTSYRSDRGSGYQYNLGGYDGVNFCFDCCGLIKTILWGWSGDKTDTTGGASVGSNGCPDCDDQYFHDKFTINDISTVDTAPVGAILWCQGHVGIYGGSGNTVECTTAGESKVQEGTVATDGTRTVSGVTVPSDRYWAAWVCPDFINYASGTSTSPQDMTGSTASMSVSDWQKAFVAQAKSHLGEDYDELGGCSSYIGLCLSEIGYCDEYVGSDNKCYWALQNEKGVLDDSSYFKEVTGDPQEGDILVSWGVHTGMYGDGGTYENVPAGGHTQGNGVIHVDGVCSCLGNPTVYRMVKSGGTLKSGAAWTGTASGSSSSSGSVSYSGSVNLRKYSIDEDSLHDYTVYKPEVSYLTTTISKTGDRIESDNTAGATTTKRGTSLLSTSTLVESPFVSVQIGDYLFGSYTKKTAGKSVSVDYPNYVSGVTVTKINGSVNTYTISLHYQIEAGSNPNLIDEILSQVGYGTIYISYGDWNMPSFIFDQESALITKVTTKVNFADSSIDYTINCTSNAVSVAGLTYFFPKRNAQPSSVISALIQNGSSYGLDKAFPGLYSSSTKMTALLRTLTNLNDSTVELEAQEGMSSVSYLNYLVSCMIPAGTGVGNISGGSYYMTVLDDVEGCTFTINKIETSGVTTDAYNTYEVDVGFPDLNNNSNVVFDFSINNDQSWSLLYDYGEDSSLSDVVYKIDNAGNLYTEKSNSLFTNNKTYTCSAKQQAWWSNMTQFPVSATLTIKGLLRPQMLMSYVRVNAFFYGHKHSSSGLYVVTKEVDSVTKNGYRTTLSLTKIAGDNDTVVTGTTETTVKLPVVTYTAETRSQKVTVIEDSTGNNWERTYTYNNNSGGSTVTNNGGTTSGATITNAIVVENGGTVSDADRETLLDQDYLLTLVASYCKSNGWQDNAIMGYLSYIYNESRPLGFYTYENPWSLYDPNGQIGGSPSNYTNLCTDNQKWLDNYLNFGNAYTNQPTCPCLGLGLLSETDTWTTSGTKTLTNATDLVNAATAQGRCWWDPSFYISYSTTRWETNVGGDTYDWADPTTFSGTATEYAKRVLCGYGMIGWRYDTVESDHASFSRYWTSADSMAKYL